MRSYDAISGLGYVSCSKVAVLYCTRVRMLSLAEVFARLASGGENGYCTVPKFEIPRNYLLNHTGFYFPEVILGHGHVGV